MAIETLPDTPDPARALPSPRGLERSSNRPGRRRWRWLVPAGLAVMLLPAASLLPLRSTSSDIAPEHLHRVAREELVVTVTEQGTLASSDNSEIKCKVRGNNTIIWVVENGTEVQPGDELVRLDTLAIEEEINERTKYAFLSQSAAERSKADVARAELAVSEYKEGRYVSELANLQKTLAITESGLRTAQNMLEHSKMMYDSGYVSELDIEEKEFAVERARLDLENVKTSIEVLDRFTKPMELKRLQGDLRAAQAQYAADKERAWADAFRRDRALEEFQYCVMKAEKGGIVIYPTAEAWKNAPEIEEGATVHKDQTLLLMPDLTKMQVKVGIHESVIERVKTGQAATITLPDRVLEGKVATVAEVTRPAGWWTGNVVKYDVLVELPSTETLKPGMTAEVELELARYPDALTIPLNCVLATETGYYCWVNTPTGLQRRQLQLGDANNMSVIVEKGLEDDDEVVVDPLAYVAEAQQEAAKTLDRSKSLLDDEPGNGSETGEAVESQESGDGD